MSGHVPVNCTDEELKSFLVKARPINIQQYPAPDDVNGVSVAGIVSQLRGGHICA